MKNQQPNLSRRSFLGQAAVSAAIGAWHPFSWSFPPQKASVSLAQMRAGAASAKITTLPLRNGLTTLMGSGGNIIVLPGHDGKLLIDSGGNVAGMIAATKENLSLSDAKTIVVPGHGPVGNRQSVADFGEMLSTIYHTVAALTKAGRSLEEVVAAKPTAKFDAKWAGGFITPELITRLVYRGT
jgi:hypothetical protein